jgi:hypothetical protein
LHISINALPEQPCLVDRGRKRGHRKNPHVSIESVVGTDFANT